MENMDRWVGKVAIVTGASSGIGAAIAEKLVEAGCEVVGVGRRLVRLQQLAKKTQGKKGKLHTFKADVSNEEDVLALFKWTAERVGPVHILVNNSGILRNAPLISGETSQWREVFATNVLGLSMCTREAVKSMRANNIDDGHIVHINSVAGHTVAPTTNVYTASKFAVTNLTEVLRNELREANTKIRVTSVSPGLVDTEGIIPALKNNPILKPEDVANCVVFALSVPAHVQIHELTVKPVGEKW